MATAIDFVRMVGIRVTDGSAKSGFLPGVQIRRGALIVDRSRCAPADVLHEAGHLATLPSCVRSYFSGDLSVDARTQRRIETALAEHPGADRFYIQSGEAEATAWAWAAGKHLGFRDDEIIRDGTYSDAQDDGAIIMRDRLTHNAYMGINGLQAAGWCLVRARPARGDAALPPVFPKLAFWLAP